MGHFHIAKKCEKKTIIPMEPKSHDLDLIQHTKLTACGVADQTQWTCCVVDQPLIEHGSRIEFEKL